MKNLESLKELILEKVNLGEVLSDYGVDFVYSPDYTEETQLRCPFHGSDNKPSARYYRDTQSMFCWVCHKRWDVIGFIMEKEQFYYKNALLYIVNKYHLDTSLIPDDPEFKSGKKVTISEVNIELISAKEDIRRLRGKIEFARYNALCTAYYIIATKSSRGGDIQSDLQMLNNKLDTIQIG